MAIDTTKRTSPKTPDAIDIFKLVNECLHKINEGEKSLGHVNIIIAGKTGVGKSTLINAAFRENMAETGMGTPVTQHTKLIERDGMPLRVYDTVGLELTEKTKQETIQNVHEIIKYNADNGDADKFVHCMWYCVQANSDRLEKPEQDFIIDIAKKIPVILVITKAYLKKHAKNFAAILDSWNMPVKKICIVLAQSYEEEETFFKAYGVEDLIETTLNILPETAQDAFINAQSSVELKNKMAMEVVNETVAMAFGAGFVPVPVADIIMLVPTEVSMMVRITNIYGLQMTKSKIKRILMIMFGAMGASATGALAARELLKFVPGLGATLGGVISGGTAAAMTLAFGKTYIFIMEKLFTGEMTERDLDTAEGREQIKKVIRGVTETDKNFNDMARSMITDKIPTGDRIVNLVKGIGGFFKFGRK